jgi:hypothetical protein
LRRSASRRPLMASVRPLEARWSKRPAQGSGQIGIGIGIRQSPAHGDVEPRERRKIA